MRDCVPWFIPSTRIDPLQTPMRNTVHDAIADDRRLGQQMHLGVDPPGDPDPPGGCDSPD